MVQNKDFEIKNGTLYKYNGNKSHVVIPNGVMKIGDGVFYRCANLTNITIPNSVTSIGRSAFSGCTRLTNIEIPNSVRIIDLYAFYGCANLTNITIPNSVRIIGKSAFDGCTGLTSITIPSGVTRIGEYAFRGCTGLTNIEIPSSVIIIGDSAFCDIAKVKPQCNANGTLRAFKAFNADWKCRDFQYEVEKSYHQDGKIECCCNGFHACTNPLDVFNYYSGELRDLRFAEVEMSGEMDFNEYDSKVAASDIKVVRELSVQELFNIYNKMEKE